MPTFPVYYYIYISSAKCITAAIRWVFLSCLRVPNNTKFNQYGLSIWSLCIFDIFLKFPFNPFSHKNVHSKYIPNLLLKFIAEVRRLGKDKWKV